MVSRIILTSAVALVGIGSIVAPVWARGAFAGAFGGHPAAFHAGMAHGPFIRPHGPFIRPHGPFVAHARVRTAHGLRRFGLRRNLLLSAPLWAGFDDIGPYYYYTGNYEVAGEEHATAAPAAVDGAPSRPVIPVMVYRPGCRTQTQTVPSEAGGTRSVNITRCY